MSTTITEIVSTTYQDPTADPTQVVKKLVAMGWAVEEESDKHVSLVHELIPGARRIVHLQ